MPFIDDDDMIDSTDDDAIVRTMNVYISPKMSQQMAVIQYPLQKVGSKYKGGLEWLTTPHIMLMAAWLGWLWGEWNVLGWVVVIKP
jgi:hypothetical protein